MATFTGTVADEFFITTTALDTVSGDDGNDVVLVAAAADHTAGEVIGGGNGHDRIWFASTTAAEELVLRSGVTTFEAVEIADIVGNRSGTTALSVDAALVITGLVLLGNAGDNEITGTAKNDVIVGGAGEDTIFGGAGDDRIFFRVDDPAFDQIDAGSASEGNTLLLVGTAADTVIVDLGAAAGVDQVTAIGAAPEGVVQSDFRDLDATEMRAEGVFATGSALVNRIAGSAQADTLSGGAGTDTVSGGAGDDVIVVANSTHHTASDVVNGGLGDNTIRFASTIVGQTLTLGARVTKVGVAEIADVAGDRSGVTALGINAGGLLAAVSLAGNDGANSLTATRFADTLEGGGGIDKLYGGGADDLYIVARGADSNVAEVYSDSAGGDDVIVFTSTAGGETLVLGASVSGIESVLIADEARVATGTTLLNINASLTVASLHLAGNDGANEIRAGKGADSVEGAGGDDTLLGGAGNDTLIGGGGSDSIVGGTGNDRIVMDAASPDEIDAGALTELNTLALTGNAGGVVVIDLGSATDQIAEIAGVADATAQKGFRNIDAASLGSVDGSAVIVTGSALANRVTGSGNNDIFIFAASTHLATGDYLDGGAGDDVIRFTSTTAKSTLTLRADQTAIETVEISDASGDRTGVVELNLNAAAVLTGGMVLNGNDGINRITGTTTADTIDGADGADTLLGGGGDDLYLIRSLADFDAGDRIVETAFGGNDTILFQSTVDGEKLILGSWLSGVEKVTLDDGAVALHVDGAAVKYGVIYTGNDAANSIVGGVGHDTIDGGRGADTIVAGAGNDVVTVDVGEPTWAAVDAGNASEGNTLRLTGTWGGQLLIDLSAGADADQLLGDVVVQSDFTHLDARGLVAGSVWVFGSAKANQIFGTELDDVFFPGLGADTVEGGDGDDEWVLFKQTEYTGDVYSDSGTGLLDIIVFHGDGGTATTLTLSGRAPGVDQAWCVDLFGKHLSINAASLDQPIALGGDMGNNRLTGNFHGQSFFDVGGRDSMYGGGGDDDYVIFDGAWVVGDVISDSAGLNDGVYFAGDNGAVLAVNMNSTISGIEQFVVADTDLSNAGPYVRDHTVTITGGIDASRYGKAILLAGSYGANALTGTKYADTIVGHLGEDTIVAGTGLDRIEMEMADGDRDAINAGKLAENNLWVLVGDAPGPARIDLSSTVEGTDQMTFVNGAPDALVQSGFLHVDASGLVSAAVDGIDIVGSAGKNTIIGSGYDDIITGGGGADSVIGGGGNDAFVVRVTTEIATGEKMFGGAGIDEVWFAWTSGSTTLTLSPTVAAEIEVLKIADSAGATTGVTALNASAAAFATEMTLVGNDGANRLTATSLNDTLEGNGGADTLVGGLGSDIYLYDAGSEIAGDVIIDTGGSDIVRFASTTGGDVLVLTAQMTQVETVQITSRTGNAEGTDAVGVDASAVAKSLTILGNSGANTLTGTALADTIAGYGGNDSIVGGAGADTIHMGVAAATLNDIDAGVTSEGNRLILSGIATGDIVFDLTSGVDQLVSIGGVDEGRTVLGIASIDASAVNASALVAVGFTITGTADANALVTQVSGDKALTDIFITATPFVAGDSIRAGAGSDEIRFASNTAGQTLTVGTSIVGVEKVTIGDATGDTSGTTALNVNTAAAVNALEIVGNDGANTITGGKFDDTITGGGGQDTVLGGAGADRMVMDVAAGELDRIDAGLASEGNALVLVGSAAGTLVVDLTAADQLVSVAGVGEALAQGGFQHVDASALIEALSITGSAAANSLTGGAAEDTIVGGLGADTITGNGGNDSIVGGAGADIIHMGVAAATLDDIDAGALAEGNALVLTGAATGTVVVDLTQSGDQLTDANGGVEARVQSGFAHVDASAMTGAAIDITGSAVANRIAGTALADVIDAGAGADTVEMDVATYDAIDAGAGSEGDTLVLVGTAAGTVLIDLFVAAGADQLVSVGGDAEATVQSDFQHVDAIGMEAFGVDLRGGSLDNTLTGTILADVFLGRAGSDSIDLGSKELASGVKTADAAADIVRYESAADGVSAAAARYSRDMVTWFESGRDKVQFTGEFNGGVDDLDDIADNDSFTFANDVRADFTLEHEALFVSFEKSLLANSALYLNNLSAVVGAVNRVGVTSLFGDDGLIVVEAVGATGFYYYEELDGIAGVSSGELTMLGLLDSQAAIGDFAIG